MKTNRSMCVLERENREIPLYFINGNFCRGHVLGIVIVYYIVSVDYIVSVEKLL